MTSSKRSAHILFFLCFFYISAYGQSQQISKDSTFSAYMDSASIDLKNHNYTVSLQKEYSDDFFNYYKQNPNSGIGNLALQRAFVMWGNIGATEMYNKAIETLGPDSKNWELAILVGHNVYYMDEKRSIEDYVELVKKLKKKVTNPAGKSQALLYLAEYYNRKGNTEKTIDLAREIIDINANEFFVDRALGFQHEAEKLGVGSMAPDFIAQTVQGPEISLSDQKGKVVVLEF